jgi:hypothetical protein
MPQNIAEPKKRTLRQSTYQAWKKAVKEIDPKASFTGDKDIDSVFKKEEYDGEWDGEKGYITFSEGYKSENSIEDLWAFIPPQAGMSWGTLLKLESTRSCQISVKENGVANNPCSKCTYSVRTPKTEELFKKHFNPKLKITDEDIDYSYSHKKPIDKIKG